MEKNARSNKCLIFKVSGIFLNRGTRKTLNEVIRKDLKEKLQEPSYEQECLEVIYKKPSNTRKTDVKTNIL